MADVYSIEEQSTSGNQQPVDKDMGDVSMHKVKQVERKVTDTPSTQMETNDSGNDFLCVVRSSATMMVNNNFSGLTKDKIQIFSDTLVAFANGDNVRNHIQKKGSGYWGQKLIFEEKSVSKMWNYLADIIGDQLHKGYTNTVERFESFLDGFVSIVIRDIRQKKAKDKK